MRNLKIGLMILAAPAVMFACQKTPGEKKAEINEEMTEEQRDHSKDMAEIRKDETNPNERAEEQREESREHAEEMTDLQKEAFLVDANRELDRLDRNIETLKEKAKNLTGAAKDETDRQIAVLENKYDAIKDDVDDAKAKTGGELMQMKQNFEASLRELEQSYNELAAKVG
jgi:hypothetical protein